MVWSKEDKFKLSSEVFCDRTRGNSHKYMYMKFRLSVQEKEIVMELVKPRNRLVGDWVKFPSLEPVKTFWHTVDVQQHEQPALTKPFLTRAV